MRIGVMGLAQSGKKTLFGMLTGASAAAGFRGDARGEFPRGVGKIPDERVDQLAGV
jgi:ribosome-binding ATPase YchF (GTP1/OBG family)